MVGTSPSDYLMSYPGHLLMGRSYSFAWQAVEFIAKCAVQKELMTIFKPYPPSVVEIRHCVGRRFDMFINHYSFAKRFRNYKILDIK